MAKGKIEKVTEEKTNKIGGIAFIIGIVLALIAGIFGFGDDTLVISALMVIGLIIGLLNISAKEAMPFLLITTALVIVSSLGGSFLGVIPILQKILISIIILMVPAVIVVAIRAVFSLARN